MHKIGDWIKVIDKNTQKILCAGKIIKYKEKIIDFTNNTFILFEAISIDNTWYFPENSLKFNIVDNPERLNIPFVKEELPNTYIVHEIKYYIQKQNADIYYDWVNDELDPEVTNLVNTLNLFENIETISSCSGHNINPLWVEIQFSSLQALCLLLKIIYEKFPFDFVLKTTPGEVDCKLDKAKLKLLTIKIGQEAYQKAEELVKELQKWAKVFH